MKIFRLLPIVLITTLIFAACSVPGPAPITLSELKEMINNDEDVTGVDTSAITDMSSLFSVNAQFNQDISGWDVSNVTTMRSMFYYATRFNQDISGWDVRKVEHMNSMFDRARDFNQDISGWKNQVPETVVTVLYNKNFSYNSALIKAYHPYESWSIDP